MKGGKRREKSSHKKVDVSSRFEQIALRAKLKEKYLVYGDELYEEKSTSKKRVVLNPKKGLMDLFGKFPEIDVKKFRKQHEEDASRHDAG